MESFFAPVTHWLNDVTGFSFSIHGYISLTLAMFGVGILYVGLLYLMRLSHRSGADEDAYEYRDPRSGRHEDETSHDP